MKLKLISILIFFSLFTKLSFGQAKFKGDVMVSAGLTRCDLYNKLFILGLSSKNGPLYAKTQKAANLFDFNITYFTKKNIGKFEQLFGIGYSPYGFKENGTALNDSLKTITYTINVRLNYGSIYGGLAYTFIKTKKVNVKLYQTLNPMFIIDKSLSIFNKIGISTRSNILVDFKFKSGNIVSISPFFETSIWKYNNVNKISGSPNFYPYSYGLNLGTYLGH